MIYGVKTGTGVIIPSSAGCKLSFRLISGGNYHARHRNATQSRWPRQTKRQAHAKLASAIALEMSNIFHSHLFGEQCPARVRSRHTSSSSSRYLQRAGANHTKRRLHPVQLHPCGGLKWVKITVTTRSIPKHVSVGRKVCRLSIARRENKTQLGQPLFAGKSIAPLDRRAAKKARNQQFPNENASYDRGSTFWPKIFQTDRTLVN